MYCSECDTHITDQHEFKCFFLENELESRKLRYNQNASLCLNCFNKMFSVLEFANQAYKNLPEHVCCGCEKFMNFKKEEINVIRCCTSKILLEVYYCPDCYEKDIGTYGKNEK